MDVVEAEGVDVDVAEGVDVDVAGRQLRQLGSQPAPRPTRSSSIDWVFCWPAPWRPIRSASTPFAP